MNPTELDSAPRILPQEIARARATARSSGKRTIEILQEQTGLEAEAFVAALGATLGYPVCAMDQLNNLLPAFDLHGRMLLRHGRRHEHSRQGGDEHRPCPKPIHQIPLPS